MKILFLLLTLFVIPLQAESQIKSIATGVTFPKYVSLDHENQHYDLKITGIAVRKKFFVKIYSVASYLQNEATEQEDLLEQIMSDNWAKQLTLKWVYDADLKRVLSGYDESFHNALGSQYSSLGADIYQFLSFFTKNVEKGDEHILRWLPGGNIEVLINNQLVGKISSPKFAPALWSLWFGDHSFVNRESLLTFTDEAA